MPRLRALDDRRALRPRATVSVSKNARLAREAQALEARAQDRARRCTRRAMRSSPRAVIHGVHRRHHREQHLRGADVRGRLLAADVLLARLQREAVGGLPCASTVHADEAPGHAALQLVAHRHVAGVRAAEAHRHAEALRAAHRARRRPTRRAA
jgi:hypothetical protein